ncbi:MAG: ABC transporter permease [Dechloromonas sp.]|uniref:ABC transporter permease n=1 Tax=Candidatus Dechloromonas phosphorivorans TaxID=2899244 RepID=A0A9D7LPT4_9RHOO|nr:ABC transporter permease [Candidatus Dechloromonas phosphorivorans]
MPVSSSTTDRSARLTRWLVTAPPAVFLVIFFLIPALIMAGASFREPGEFGGLAPLAESGPSLDAYRFILDDVIYAWILAKSFAIAGLTTVICLLFAYPLAMLIVRSPKRQRDVFILLVILPFASNFLIRIYAWMIILGPLDLLYSPVAVVVGMVYVHLPFMILPLYTNLEKHDPALLEAAQDLGAGKWAGFWRVTWPLSLPGVLSGSSLVFIPVLGMFAVPELLGGTGDLLMGNLIKEQFLDNRDWPLGAALSLLLTLAVLAVAGLSAVLTRNRGQT